MSQTYENGIRIPVTKIQAGPCIVTQIKSESSDGYWAVQLGFGSKKTKNISKPLQGHLKKSLKAKATPKYMPRYIKEIKTKEEPKYAVGDEIKVSDIFNPGDLVTVSGTSKGKGFAGGVKRWHFSGGPKTHGQSDRLRAPGSIGQGTTPGRVYKGKHMAGRMGSERVKIKGLKVVSVNPEKNEIEINGPVPGTVGSLVVIEKMNRKEKSA